MNYIVAYSDTKVTINLTYKESEELRGRIKESSLEWESIKREQEDKHSDNPKVEPLTRMRINFKEKAELRKFLASHMVDKVIQKDDTVQIIDIESYQNFLNS